MAVSDYSTTPSSNVTVGGIYIGEGCAPANINNAIRQMMADLAVEYEDGAEGVKFQRSADIPADNVQAAIESVQAGIPSPASDFGLGVTGNAPLLANLDAKNTPSGFYRFGAETAGTFPSGVTKAGGGVVLVFRRTSDNVKQMLIPIGTAPVYLRNVGSEIGSWDRMLTATSQHSQETWDEGTSTNIQGISPAQLRETILQAVREGAVGVDQQWIDYMTTSPREREHNTIYQNTTGRTITVSITIWSWNPTRVQVSLNATDWINVATGYDAKYNVTFPVPNGYYYRLLSTRALDGWAELR